MDLTGDGDLDILSYSATARDLGVSRATIADVARLWGYPPLPVPGVGHSKGLDAAARRAIRRRLGIAGKAGPARRAAVPA